MRRSPSGKARAFRWRLGFALRTLSSLKVSFIELSQSYNNRRVSWNFTYLHDSLAPHAPFPITANTPGEDRPAKTAIGTKLLQNLMMTLKSLLAQQLPSQEVSSPQAKRVKTEYSDEAPLVHDPYKIWVGQNEEPPKKEGALLVQLTSAGLVNALAGHPGGIVDAKVLFVDPAHKLDSLIPSAGNISFKELRANAIALHRVVQTRLEADFLSTTPSRIIDMLAADLAPHEFSSVRRRVHETVIEGRGRNQGGHDEADDLPVGSRIAEHDIERVSGEIDLLYIGHLL